MYRITVEKECEDCHGRGQVREVSGNNLNKSSKYLNCSGCDSTGYQEITVRLGSLPEYIKEDQEYV